MPRRSSGCSGFDPTALLRAGDVKRLAKLPLLLSARSLRDIKDCFTTLAETGSHPIDGVEGSLPETGVDRAVANSI
ncbi:MAG: hypothetical protein HRU33_22260 [Rhodobacteraceae bacterium]|nr:hypothetical protein [Paracoccaceae bacterium]